MCWRVCKNVWDIYSLSDPRLCRKLSGHFSRMLSRAPVIRKIDCDQPVLCFSWRMRQYEHPHPVFNARWCSVTGIEKSKNSPATDVPCTQRAEESWEEYACSHLSVMTSLDMYLKAHTHFEGIWGGCIRKNTELCTFCCFLGKWFWTERMKMKKCYSSVVQTTEVLFYISIVQGLKSRRVGK